MGNLKLVLEHIETESKAGNKALISVAGQEAVLAEIGRLRAENERLKRKLPIERREDAGGGK